jgi:hypothetical protein
MSENFESGLRDLHDGAALAHASGDGFPTAAMVGRVRRNRRVRAGALSAVAAVAVVGVVWAGSAVAGLVDSAPIEPAQPSVTPEPPDTDTAEPDAYAGPDCGSVIGDVPVFDEPPLVIEATLDRDVAGPADPLPVRVVLAVPNEFEVTLEPDGMLEGLDYTAVQDGVVVAYGSGPLVEGTWQTLSGRQGVTALASISLQPCDADTTSLAAGDYELFASIPVTLVGESDEANSRTILGGPWPFIIAEGPSEESSDDPVLWDPVAAAAPPCGEPFALAFVDSPLIEVTGGIVLGTYDRGLDHFAPSEGSSHLVVSTLIQSETLSPINGTSDETTYLLDAEGRVAFWDFHRIEDDDWDFGTRSPKFLLYEARNCLTGEALAGTYRVVMAVTRDDPALPAPDVEVGELEPVEFPAG